MLLFSICHLLYLGAISNVVENATKGRNYLEHVFYSGIFALRE